MVTAGKVCAGVGARRYYDDDNTSDRGAMTVTTAFAMAAILAVAVAVLLVGRATAAAHVARSAADLSALAGAHALREGSDVCAVAAQIAEANGAGLAVCTVDGQDVVTRAVTTVELGLFGSRATSAVARAGPV